MAAALIVLTIVGSGGTWHGADTDQDLHAALAPHDHADHRESFRAQPPDTPPEHCALCHWLQGFRTDGARPARVQPLDTATGAVPPAATSLPRSSAALDLPSRAPPV